MQLRTAIRAFLCAAGVLVLAVLVTMVVTQRRQIRQLQDALRSREADLKELDRLRAEAREAQGLRNQQTEIDQLREDNKDLFRLRNEVSQLRQQQSELDGLREANAQLLQVLQGVSLNSNQQALVVAARRRGAVLGISAVSSDDPQAGTASARYRGAVVLAITPDSPVARSDLKVGDIIVRVDGRPIASAGQLQSEMLTRKPGESVALDVMRQDTQVRIVVQLRAYPQ